MQREEMHSDTLSEENRLLKSMNKSRSNVFTAGQSQSSLYFANHKSANWEMSMRCTQHYPNPLHLHTTQGMTVACLKTIPFYMPLPDFCFTLLNHFQLQEALKVLWSAVILTEENKYLISQY